MMLPLDGTRSSVDSDIQSWIAHLMRQRITPAQALKLLGYSDRLDNPTWGKVEHTARRLAVHMRAA